MICQIINAEVQLIVSSINLFLMSSVFRIQNIFMYNPESILFLFRRFIIMLIMKILMLESLESKSVRNLHKSKLAFFLRLGYFFF